MEDIKELLQSGKIDEALELAKANNLYDALLAEYEELLDFLELSLSQLFQKSILEIRDFKGKELNCSYLPNLREIYCHNCSMTAFNIIHCPQLSAVTLIKLEGGRLCMEALENCKSIEIEDTKLDQLLIKDLQKVEREKLNFINSRIKKLKVENVAQLAILDLMYNTVTEASFNNLPFLRQLTLRSIGLEKLEVSGCSNLREFDGAKNKLQELTITDSKQLEEFCCEENELQILDLSAATQLKWLDCGKNQLKQLLLAEDSGNLYSLKCSHNQLETLVLTSAAALETLHCSHNQLKSIAMPESAYVLMIDCSHNQLNSLDFSATDGFDKLNCAGNKLTALDMSNQSYLLELNCEKNQISELDLGLSAKLTKLYCAENQIEKLILPATDTLLEMDCSSNKLTTLDISKCPELKDYLVDDGVDVITNQQD